MAERSGGTHRWIPVTFLAGLVFCFGTACPALLAAADHVDEEISQTVNARDYWLYSMFLEEGQKIEFDFSVSSGLADFYFLDSGQLSEFLAYTGQNLTGGWGYDTEKSQLDTSSIQRSGTIGDTGTYHIAVVNENSYEIMLSGTIKASYPTSFLTIALIAGVVAAAVVIVLVIVVSRQNKALQQSVETFETPFRSPPSPPRTPTSHAPTGHQAYLDHTASRCRNCGTLVVRGASYCKFCGARVGP